jgi:hypothetical protein
MKYEYLNNIGLITSSVKKSGIKPSKNGSPQTPYITKLQNMEIDKLYKEISVHSGSSNYDYSMLWQVFLVEKYFNNMNLYDIQPSARRNVIFKVERENKQEIIDSKRETVQCRNIKISHSCLKLGNVIDYQVPLLAGRIDRQLSDILDNKNAGEIDLVSILDSKINLIEYKTPDSKEPMLRAILEIITYYIKVSRSKALNSYISSFNQIFGQNFPIIKDSFSCSILIPFKHYFWAHPLAYQLREQFNIRCFTFLSDDNENDNYKNIRELSELELIDGKMKSESHFQEMSSETIEIIDCFEKELNMTSK